MTEPSSNTDESSAVLSRVPLFATPWTAARQAPLSMGFSRKEYWSGLPSPSAGDLPGPRIELEYLILQADCLPSEPPGKNLSKSTFNIHISSKILFEAI